MSDTSGQLLAKAIKTLNDEIGSTVTEEGLITKESMSKLLYKVILNFNTEMSNNSTISQGSLDIILLTLSNYSIIERRILEASGRKLDNKTRNTVLEKSFHMLKTGTIPDTD